MPNPSQINKAAERRAARAGKKAANVDAAAQQEHELAALSDRLRGIVKPDPDDSGNETVVVAKAKSGTRAEQKAATQAAAAAQAEVDVRATVNPLQERDEHDLSWYRANNVDPPLHVLNAIARRADNVQKDDARIAAQAAGKAAYDALTEHRSARSHESRYKTMDKTMTDARNAAAAKAQADAAGSTKK